MDKPATAALFVTVTVLTVGCYPLPGMVGPVRNPERATAPAPPIVGTSDPRPEPPDEPVGPKPVAGPGDDDEVPPGEPEPEPVMAGEPEPEDSEALWSEVASSADSLTVKRWQIRFAKENFAKTPKNAQAIKNMEKHHDAIVAEEFCPAAIRFRAVAGAREYNKRATKHCKTAAPIAAGLAGKQVTLTTECVAAFSTSCG